MSKNASVSLVWSGITLTHNSDFNSAPWDREEQTQLLFPIVLTVLSALHLLTRLVTAAGGPSNSDPAARTNLNTGTDTEQLELPRTRVSKLRARLASHGGPVIIVCKLLGLIGCIALAVLSALTYIQCIRTEGVQREDAFQVDIWSKGRWHFRRGEYLQAGMFAVYVGPRRHLYIFICWKYS